VTLRAGNRPNGWLGVGLDVEQVSGLGRFDEASVLRAGRRWLRPAERAWCAAQPSFREAMIVALSCKEAVYKSLPSARPAHEIALTMHGSAAAGWARSRAFAPLRIAVRWRTSKDRIVALAVTANGLEARRILGLLLRHYSALDPDREQSPGAWSRSRTRGLGGGDGDQRH